MDTTAIVQQYMNAHYGQGWKLLQMVKGKEYTTAHVSVGFFSIAYLLVKDGKVIDVQFD